MLTPPPPQLTDDHTADLYLSEAISRNRPRLISVSPTPPSLSFLLMAFSLRRSLDFAYVSTARETRGRDVGVAVAGTRFMVGEKKLMAFKEDPLPILMGNVRPRLRKCSVGVCTCACSCDTAQDLPGNGRVLGMGWHGQHVIQYGVSQATCHSMEWHEQHVIQHGVAQATCHTAWSGTGNMSYSMEWHEQHVIQHGVAQATCHTTEWHRQHVV